MDSTTPPGSLAAGRAGNSIFEIKMAGGGGASLDAPIVRGPRALPRGLFRRARKGPEAPGGSQQGSDRMSPLGGELCIAISSSTGRQEDLKLFFCFGRSQNLFLAGQLTEKTD